MATAGEELRSLNTAIKTEKDGRAFYLEAARRAANPLATSVFEHLAEEELVHIETIQAFHDDLKETGSCESVGAQLVPPETHHSRLQNVFEKARQHMDREIKADAGSLQAYKKAMELEQKAYDMYHRLIETTGDCTAKKLYEFMMDQENQHYAFLKETHDYLEHPGDWYVREEKPHFEG